MAATTTTTTTTVRGFVRTANLALAQAVQRAEGGDGGNQLAQMNDGQLERCLADLDRLRDHVRRLTEAAVDEAQCRARARFVEAEDPEAR